VRLPQIEWQCTISDDNGKPGGTVRTHGGVVCTSMSTAQQIPLATVWSAGGVIAGFQVAAFTLRMNREIAVGDQQRITWLPPADFVNLASLAITLLGVFVAPISGLYGEVSAAKVLGLSLILLACYPFSLAGHYELFNYRTGRSFGICPFQERVSIAVTGILSVAYILLVMLH
jgi:hypothetical protein